MPERLAHSPAQGRWWVQPRVVLRWAVRAHRLAAAMLMGQGRARGLTMLPLQTAAGPGFEQAAPDPVNRPEPARNSEAGTVPEVGDPPAVGRLTAMALEPEPEPEPEAVAVGPPALARPPVLAFGTSVEGQLAPVQTGAAVGREAEAEAALALELAAAIAVEPAPEVGPRVGPLAGLVEAETEALESLPTTPSRPAPPWYLWVESSSVESAPKVVPALGSSLWEEESLYRPH